MKLMSVLIEAKYNQRELKHILRYEPSTNELWTDYDAGDDDIPLGKLPGKIGEAKLRVKEIVQSLNALGFEAKVGGKVTLHMGYRDIEEPYFGFIVNIVSKQSKKIAQSLGIDKR